MKKAIQSKLKSLQQYLYPRYPLSSRVSPRLKLGLMNYAQVPSWWGVAPLQKLIKARRFTFSWLFMSRKFSVKIPGGDTTQMWALDEIFAQHNYDLGQVPFAPDVILDLGANIGLFALLASQKWPQSALVCVEPHPATFALLCENLQANDVVASKLQCAVSQEAALQFMSDEGAAISERLTETGSAKTRTLTLALPSLIPPAPELKLLIKMDIEGAEFDALAAVEGHLPQQCFLFVEIHQGDADLERINRWAQENGFRYVMGRRTEDFIDGYLTRA